MFHNVRTSILATLRRALRARGYQVQRTTPIDARWSEESPRELLIREAATLSRSLVVNVPVSCCRSELGEAITERHPFVATLAAGLPRSFTGSVLEAYYRQCQPASATELLGLSEAQAPGFAGLPAHAHRMPWRSGDQTSIIQERDSVMRREAARWGLQLTISDGHQMYGPVSPMKGELEIDRLARIYKAMSLDGYQRNDGPGGDIDGWLLTDAGGEWCVLVRIGQHRIAVAAALGMTSVPVRIRHAPVKREEVMYWPQVAEGRITPEGALAVFDRTMKGDPPPICQFDWVRQPS